jgi:hypothetical protein
MLIVAKIWVPHPSRCLQRMGSVLLIEPRKSLSQQCPCSGESSLQGSFGHPQRARCRSHIHLVKIKQNHRLAVTQRQGQNGSANGILAQLRG